MKLNRDKCKIGLSEISYIGHVLSKDGLKPDMGKVRAIQEIPEPQDKTELQRIMGMVQYLAKFIPNLAEVSPPLRKLLEARLQKMLMRLQKYSLNVNYKPGKEMHIADALSRASLKDLTDSTQEEELDVSYVVQQLPVSEEKLQQFKEATQEDEELRQFGGTENPTQKGKAVKGPKRAVFGELTNVPVAAVNTKKNGSDEAATKSLLKRKTKQTAVQHGRPPKADEILPSSIQEESAGVSMMEEELYQAFSETLLDVEDIDKNDSDMPQMCSEYVKDIFVYLRSLEEQQAVRPKYMQGYKINGRMRAVLVDWLIEVHANFQLLQETLYLTVAVLDRFLQVHPISQQKLQLVGVTAMFLASKYEEMDCVDVGDLAYVTDNSFSNAQILEMERVIFRQLNFNLGRPLPIHFLRRASKASNSNVETHILAKYLMELTLLDYDMVHYRPSEIAAASLYLAQLLFDELPWSSTQKHYTTYDEIHLKPIGQHIAKNVVIMNEEKTKFQAVKGKYSCDKLIKVSLAPQLKSPVLTNMAAPLLKP
ncbi:G2/mitotic-specific cyclin-B2-like [Lampris incognitus]|uniref:G2/mitotic-specific cyclin-B2-like n=1 Tax=Lampris incognitus TaxID=2546036 RepID=UPI0024B6038C|nr:G2/mitotic-specific cyclin-B2-like [Lampris incognitus]